MADQVSPRVNSARLPDYDGRIVRLTCEVLNVDKAANEAIVKASDGGQVRIMLSGLNGAPLDKCVEIIGKVTDHDQIRAHAAINLGDGPLDMALVDFVVEKLHDPKMPSIM